MYACTCVCLCMHAYTCAFWGSCSCLCVRTHINTIIALLAKAVFELPDRPGLMSQLNAGE